MNYRLEAATAQKMPVLKNLLQFYMYDFSAFTHIEQEADGLFSAYAQLEDYWTMPYFRFPYLVMLEGRYAGFVLVKKGETEDRFSIAEFFIMKEFRRNQLGTAIARDIFEMHKGRWQVSQQWNNLPAQAFWRNAIYQYTRGDYTESIENGKTVLQFNN